MLPQELHKRSAGASDADAIANALQIVSKVAAHINESIRGHENQVCVR